MLQCDNHYISVGRYSGIVSLSSEAKNRHFTTEPTISWVATIWWDFFCSQGIIYKECTGLGKI